MGIKNLWESFTMPSEPDVVGERPLHYGLYVNEVRTPEEIAALELAYRSVEEAATELDTRQIGHIALPPFTPREPDPGYWERLGAE